MRKQKIVIKTQKVTKENNSISFIMERDYTQTYDCFCEIMINIDSSTSGKLLFWLLVHKIAPKGEVQVDSHTYEEFNNYLILKRGDSAAIVRRTFDNCVAELRTAGALTMVTRGHYKINAFVLWKGSIKDRTDHLISEYNNAKYSFYNPDHDTKLID